MGIPSKVLLTLAIIWLASMSQAQAQNDTSASDRQTESSLTLQPLDVEAARVGRPASALPSSVQIIERDQLEQQKAVGDSLSDTLGDLIPNFSPSRQKLTSFGESLRGRSPLYLIDGVPQSNPLRDSSRDGTTIDSDFIERVEVIQGSNAIQGLGAVGGLINLVTRSPDPSGRWTNDIKVSGTSADFEDDGFGYKTSYFGGKAWSQTDLAVGLAYQKRGAYFDGNGLQVGIDDAQGDLQDSESIDGFLKAGTQLGPGRVQLTVNRFRLRGDGDFVGVSGDRSQGEPATSRPGDPVADPIENDVTTVSLEYKQGALYGGELRTQFFYQDFAAKFGGSDTPVFQDPAIAPPGTLIDQSENRSEKFGVRIGYTRKDLLIKGFSATAGFDFLRDQTEQALVQTNRLWVPETNFNNYAPFLQLGQDLLDERLHITAGLRYERAELDVPSYQTIAFYGSQQVDGGQPDFDELLPNAGVLYKFDSGLRPYASYSRGFTLPDVGRVLRAVDQPDTDIDTLIALEPIVADNLEAGLDFERGSLRLHGAYFRSDSDEGARLQDTGGVFAITRQRTEISGYEFTGSVALGQDWLGGFIYSRIKGRFDSDGDGTVDSDLDGVNINPNRLNVYLENVTFEPFDLDFARELVTRLQVSRLASRTFNGPGAPDNQNFEGYTTADLFFGLRTRPVEINLGLENLFNRQFITYYGQAGTDRDDRFFAGRGRTLTLTLEREF